MSAPRPSEPFETEAPASQARRAAIQAELLRLSNQPGGPVLAVQFLLDCAVAALFAWQYSPGMALLWLALVVCSTTWRLFRPQHLPDTLDAQSTPAQVRLHTLRVSVHAGVHGLAGVLLFDPTSLTTQLLLALVMMGMTLSAAFSLSYVARAMQLAIALLLGPLILMSLVFGAPPLDGLALLGTGLIVMMWGQVADRARKLEDSIGQRHNESVLRAQALAGLHAAELAQVERLRFFSAANHDLRQPVMAIGLQAEVLGHQLRDGAPPAVLQATLDALGRAQSVMEGLTQQLLEIGRIEAGADPLAPGPVPLAPLLDEYARTGDDRRVRVRCPEGALAWTDPMALRRIVANLVDNALKFTPRNGRVMLACRRRGALWRIEVRDNGIGIPPDEHERVFRDFEQVGNAARNLSHGHGLGLAIVRRQAQRLGTRVDLRSSPGRGAVFSFDVPAYTESVSTVPAAPALVDDLHPTAEGDAGAAPLRPGLTVLVVEDNAVVAESLAALLHHWQVRTHLFGSADELLDGGSLLLAAADLVLCDIRLPGALDGVALAQQLQIRWPGLPIALVSADIDDATRALARERGWQALRKPVQPAALHALLRAVQRPAD
ncbi:hybrid sensor histidine kinase/response regulator [Variovorax sp.]|uniref:hybrid sensor histidine kinase/response regulator n=1 Tax=Variovorax sp. TaxID=1871043 RepID=UPI002D610FD3|nr:hybrid sensor histidine kinase/response regulator [Variovorax sp.]HYP84184.1 hybrid sensor histidine kinase/response regulator [Variovorax sp.]